METLKNIWEGWKRIGQLIGDFIARVVLSIFYFTLLMPFGLIVHLWLDPLGIRSSPAGWNPRSERDPSINEARRLS